MTTSSRTDSTGKKDTQKLQRAVIDGLEDVKAQDIQVFDTERLSALFERVIVASGTSNRQTKALAASVRDAVRDAGFAKPRVEGEENGEWIIVDCGAIVVHVMQPAIRQYYHLEELWGEKPVRLKLGASKPAVPVKAEAPAAKPGPKIPNIKRASAAKAGALELNPPKPKPRKPSAAKTAGKTVAQAPARKRAAPAPAPVAPVAVVKAPAVKAVAAKTPAVKTAPKAVVLRSTPVKGAVAKTAAAKTAAKAAVPARVKSAPAKAPVKARAAPVKTVAAKAAPAKSAAAKKPAAKKAKA
jgi:ribosome-associated protein